MTHDLVNGILRAALDLLGNQLQTRLLLRRQHRHAVIEENDRSVGQSGFVGGDNRCDGSSCRGIGGGVLSGGSLRLSGGELLSQLGVLKLGGFDSGHACGNGVLERLNVGSRIARYAALPAALVKAVGEARSSAEAEQVGTVRLRGAYARRRQHAFQLDIEVERTRQAELVEQTVRERESLMRAGHIVLLALVREVRSQITETYERHQIIGPVVAVTARPVREVKHKVGMHEEVRPLEFAQIGVIVGKLTALQLQTHTYYRMHPFYKRKVRFESETFSERPRIGTVRQGSAYTAAQRHLPVIPKSIGHKTCKTRFFGRLLRPCRRRECHDRKN